MNYFDKVNNIFWEFYLGIKTRGVTTVDPGDKEHIHYGTVPYRTINTILDNLQLSPNDVFVDLGCGKGRVVCCSSLRKIRQSIGVEYSTDLSALAKCNAVKVKNKRSSIKIITTDAEQFDFTIGSIYYLFHPFGPKTLKNVLNGMYIGLQRLPRPIKIVYVNPVHHNVFKEYPWLVEYDRWEPRFDRSSEHQIQWWRNTIYA
jgi:SAM-dependent methyltransferase